MLNKEKMNVFKSEKQLKTAFFYTHLTMLKLKKFLTRISQNKAGALFCDILCRKGDKKC